MFITNIISGLPNYSTLVFSEPLSIGSIGIPTTYVSYIKYMIGSDTNNINGMLVLQIW